MSIASSIFREYDIRGIAGVDLREEDAYHIARAFAAKAIAADSNATLCVGRDGRVSSPGLLDALCRGLTDSGVHVIDVGLGPTPMLYYAAHTLGATGGIMVTGSHNPPDHNGLKFVFQNKAFFGADILALRTAITAQAFVSGTGTRTSKNISSDYLSALLNAYGDARPLRAAWDAGNGAAGEIMKGLCSRLPGEHIPLNETIDGTFPVHHPDPTEPKNLVQLIDVVRKEKLDIGIAFDGDGDRIGVVDDEGEIIWGDQLLLLLAQDLLTRLPGATVIADVKASEVLFEGIKAAGGTPLMWKTGHSHIKSKMKETGAPLAGEMSGHMFFADDYYGFDDALYAAVRVLAMLARSGTKLSSLRKAIPTRAQTPEIRFHCDDARKFTVIEEVRARLTAAGTHFSAVDGMRVSTPDGWWLLRASNTQPMLVARCEAMEIQGLERLKQDLRSQLSLSNVALP